MRRQKDWKSKKHRQRLADEQYRRAGRDRLERVLDAFGLLQGFRDLLSRVRKAVLDDLPGRPRVEASASGPAADTLNKV